LVGNSKQPWRKAEAECPGGVEVDHELEFDRLHDRQVGGLLALENPAGVYAGLAICVTKARSVAHQAADLGSVAPGIDRKHPMVGRQCNELYATVVEERAGTYQQRINRLLGKSHKGHTNVTAGAGLKDFDLLPDRQGRSLHVRDKGLCDGKVGIDQQANAHGCRLQLMQQPKLLCPKLSKNKRDTGDIAARPVETGDEAELNRVAAACEDDRDCRSRRLGCNCRRGVMRSDHRHLTAYQIGCEVGQSVDLVLRPAILDRHILALDVAGFTNALPECGQIARTIDRPRAAQETYHRHRRLLRARRERPRRRGAAEQRDERAALHSITSSARVSTAGGISRPIVFAVLRLITNLNFVGCSTGRSAGLVPLRIRSTYSAAWLN